MKSYFRVLYMLVFATAAIAQDLPRGHPQVDVQRQNAATPNLPKKGKVLSTIDVSQYTYIEVIQDQKPLWLATTTIPVKTGDMIRFEDGVVMTNFYSNALKRNFPVISFVGTVVVSNDKE
jgi:hypothetical protein